MRQLDFGIFFDPASEEYRRPIGALETGEDVTLRLKVRSESIHAVGLVLFNDAGGESIPMEKEECAGVSFFKVNIKTPQSIGTLWYYFSVWADGSQFFVCPEQTGKSCRGTLSASVSGAFQLTVFKKGFKTPDWFKKSVMYQIFPDRFARGDGKTVKAGLEYHRSMGRRPRYHEDWNDTPDFEPVNGEKYYEPCDFYGGTLAAIEEKLPYLSSLGVTCLYLNPIFESASNHRYDTANYEKVDPILGTEEDLISLYRAAEKLGIKVILDGVFSHVGADSVYFDQKGTYGSGACRGESSPYYRWFDFRHFPDEYRCWWGFKNLPEVCEEEQSWRDYIIGSVMPSRIKEGCAGFRLDVADELPDEVLRLMRESVKNAMPDALLLGEVWEDATNKRSYGMARDYALGVSLDSVMNYPLRKELLNFMLFKTDAHALAAFLLMQRLNYPPQMYYCLMNLLSSHDVERVRTVLSSGIFSAGMSREEQAHFKIMPRQDDRGAELQKLCVAAIYSLPGVPAIYYGDELGMHGMADPFCRGPFREGEGRGISAFYADMARIRDESSAFAEAAFFAPDDDILCILRTTAAGVDAFGEKADPATTLTVINRADRRRNAVCDICTHGAGLTEKTRTALEQSGVKLARSVTDGSEVKVQSGLLNLSLSARSAEIYRLF